MRLYMVVTQDEYELPLVIADSQAELARKLGISRATVNTYFHRIRHGTLKDTKYRVVDIDDDE